MSKINKLVIIGFSGVGGPAAMMTKRMDPMVDVTVIREEKHLTVRCSTAYISIGKAVPEASVKNDEMFRSIGVKFVDVPATRINRKEKTVTTIDGSTYSYDKLILATGGKAIVPQIPGVNLKGIFKIRTIEDAVSIREWIKEKEVRDVVVYGAGSIGLEMASLIAQKGIKVTLVVRSYIGRKAGLDPDMSGELENYFNEKGVTIRSGEVIKNIIGEDRVEAVELSSGDKIKTDMIVLSIGVHPRIKIAEEAELEIGEYGLKVNKYLQTSDLDIYSAGDLIEYEHSVTGKPSLGQLRSNAVIGGRIAAKNALGYKIEFPKLLNSLIVKLFDKSIASVGITEATAREEGIDVFVAKRSSKTKYAMIEGGKPYILKLVFDKSTKKIIGAQIIADDERSVRYIDVIAVAIRNSWTALDLITLRCASQPELAPEASGEPIALAAEDAFKEFYSNFYI